MWLSGVRQFKEESSQRNKETVFFSHHRTGWVNLFLHCTWFCWVLFPGELLWNSGRCWLSIPSLCAFSFSHVCKTSRDTCLFVRLFFCLYCWPFHKNIWGRKSVRIVKWTYWLMERFILRWEESYENRWFLLLSSPTWIAPPGELHNCRELTIPFQQNVLLNNLGE